MSRILAIRRALTNSLANRVYRNNDYQRTDYQRTQSV
jgi:hypothetical protein